MDAFASVGARPELRGKPVAVGGAARTRRGRGGKLRGAQIRCAFRHALDHSQADVPTDLRQAALRRLQGGRCRSRHLRRACAGDATPLTRPISMSPESAGHRLGDGVAQAIRARIKAETALTARPASPTTNSSPSSLPSQQADPIFVIPPRWARLCRESAGGKFHGIGPATTAKRTATASTPARPARNRVSCRHFGSRAIVDLARGRWAQVRVARKSVGAEAHVYDRPHRHRHGARAGIGAIIEVWRYCETGTRAQ